jgi:hypothetical protein
MPYVFLSTQMIIWQVEQATSVLSATYLNTMG